MIGLALVVGVGLFSLRVGTRSITTQDAWDAIFHFNPKDYDQNVVRNLRVPRTIIALSVGASLAVAGAVLQAVTRNPLADPSILGISNGASFAIVTAFYYGNLTRAHEYVPVAFAGALLASLLVFVIGSAGRGGASPVKLALAGVVVSSLLTAWTSALLFLDRQTFEAVRFWFAGSVAGRELDVFWMVAPFLLGGSLICLFLGHQLNVLALGDETAQALGMRTTRTRLVCWLVVVVMIGAAVSVAGPIAFVGLAVPHMVRSVIGPDYRWSLPYSLLAGAIFLTLVDVVGRVVMRPGELEVGIATALLGAPFLVYLARRRSVAQ